MKTTFKSKLELTRYYADEENCKKLLAQQRWGNSPACPHCGNAGKIYTTNRGYKCGEKTCYKKFTVTTGTIFENTKIPLNKWFEAIFVITAHKKGISSLQLAKDIDVTDKTAWFILHRVREMLRVKNPSILSGTKPVQVDELYYGGAEKNKHKSKRTEGNQRRSTKTKTPILGILQDGKIFAKPVVDTKARNIIPIMVANVAEGSTIHTDEWRSYRSLSKLHYDHKFVRHNDGQYVNGEVHVNGCENFWSHFSRGVIGIYHQVSTKHLARYCDEYAFRYNTRKITDVERFTNVLTHCEGRLKWDDLTANNE